MTDYEVHLKLEDLEARVKALEEQASRLQETVNNVTANKASRALKAVVAEMYEDEEE